MDKFTARNDATVEQFSKSLDVQTRGASIWLEPWAVDALREFFQAERDEELGRWRWPKNPDYVIYPDEDGDVVVLGERDGRYGILQTRATLDRYPSSFGAEAARAYFDAHPTRKPWEDAKPGEVWVIDEANRETTAARACMVNDRVQFEPVNNITHRVDVDDSSIINARRIWPEVSDAVD